MLGAALERFYQWWYPPSKDPYPYYGYYGPKRISRAAIVRKQFKRRLRNSLVGRAWLGSVQRFTVWWYPPGSDQAHYPQIPHRRISRPVRAYRKWNRWFRQTWLGREFGWLLDEAANLAWQVWEKVRPGNWWRQVDRFLSRREAVAILVVLIIAGFLFNRYGVPRYRRYLENKYARQAREFIQKKDYARAYLRARQALQIDSNNALATQVNADLADWANSPFAVYWRQRSVVLEPSSTNRIALASTALRMEDFPFLTATKALNEVPNNARSSSTYQMAAGALSIKLNNLAEAEQHYNAAVQLDPTNPITRMSLAVVQLQSRDPKTVTDSRITLELLNADGRLGIMPLRSLVAESLARKEFDRAERLSNQILTNAESTFGDQMLHLVILNAAQRPGFSTALTQTETNALRNPAFIGELAAWLNRAGLADESLKWLNGLPRQTLLQGLIPLAVADAYVAQKHWKELQKFLESDHWLGLEYVRIALLTLAIRNQNQSEPQSYSVAWQRAIGLAADSSSSVNMLAQLAASWGWKTETEQVLWFAVEKFGDQTWPLDGLKGLYAYDKNTRGLRRVFQTQAKRDPEDKYARNNFVMVSLLLGSEVAAAHKAAAELHASDPENPNFAATYAFSLHMQGKTREGIEVLRALKPEELAKPGISVYYGLLLAASGGDSTAQEFLARSDKAFLLPEELALVAAARKSL
jgi:Flp pilus assembly protein TadD